jgi:hypothetical protein
MADRTALNAAIASKTTVVDAGQGDYTEASWNNFTAALSAAQGVYEDDDAEQEDIDEALTNLTDAHAALEEYPDTGGGDNGDNGNQGGTGPTHRPGSANLLSIDVFNREGYHLFCRKTLQLISNPNQYFLAHANNRRQLIGAMPLPPDIELLDDFRRWDYVLRGILTDCGWRPTNIPTSPMLLNRPVNIFVNHRFIRPKDTKSFEVYLGSNATAATKVKSLYANNGTGELEESAYEITGYDDDADGNPTIPILGDFIEKDWHQDGTTITLTNKYLESLRTGHSHEITVTFDDEKETEGTVYIDVAQVEPYVYPGQEVIAFTTHVGARQPGETRSFELFWGSGGDAHMVHKGADDDLQCFTDNGANGETMPILEWEDHFYVDGNRIILTDAFLSTLTVGMSPITLHFDFANEKGTSFDIMLYIFENFRFSTAASVIEVDGPHRMEGTILKGPKAPTVVSLRPRVMPDTHEPPLLLATHREFTMEQVTNNPNVELIGHLLFIDAPTTQPIHIRATLPHGAALDNPRYLNLNISEAGYQE